MPCVYLLGRPQLLFQSVCLSVCLSVCMCVYIYKYKLIIRLINFGVHSARELTCCLENAAPTAGSGKNGISIAEHANKGVICPENQTWAKAPETDTQTQVSISSILTIPTPSHTVALNLVDHSYAGIITGARLPPSTVPEAPDTTTAQIGTIMSTTSTRCP